MTNYLKSKNNRGDYMKKIFVIIILFTMISACSKNINVDTGIDEESAGTIVIEPDDPNTVGLSTLPDKSLEKIPSGPLSPSFIIEHRSYLNGKKINIQGVVVDTFLGEEACPPGRGMCGMPSLYIADSLDENRDNYKVRILMSEDDQNYNVGDKIEFSVLVDGNKAGLVLVKVY